MTTLFLQKPRPIPTIFTVIAVIVCLACGIWQLQRMAWKHDKMQLIEERIGLPEVPLPATMANPEEWEYRHVAVTGTFLHDKESYTPAQSTRGNYGFQVITPLERPDGSLVLVNRGWVPDPQRDPAARAEGQEAARMAQASELATEARAVARAEAALAAAEAREAAAAAREAAAAERE